MSSIDWHRVHDRLQLVVDTLVTRHICDGFPRKRVEVEARPVLWYARRRADGFPEDENADVLLAEFARRYGQSLDWILIGDIACMICAGAARRHGARP